MVMENSSPVINGGTLEDCVIETKICDATKVQYRRKVNNFKSWISREYPECIDLDHDEINLTSIEPSMLRNFFADVCQKRRRDNSISSPVEYQSVQHLSGYKCAIKDYYNCKRVKMPIECESVLKDFFQGYERKIEEQKQVVDENYQERKQLGERLSAEKRKIGEISPEEGKQLKTTHSSSANGVSTSIQLTNQIANLNNRVSAVRDEIMAKFDELPQKFTSSITDSIPANNGSAPITLNQFKDIIKGFEVEMLRTIHRKDFIPNSDPVRPSTSSVDVLPPQPPPPLPAMMTQFQTWIWKGSLHPVPQSFKFPKCSVHALWDLWWAGNAMERLMPYCTLQTSDLDHKNDNQLLSKAKYVMHKLLESFDDSNFRDKALQQLSEEERGRLLERSYVAIFRELYPSEGTTDMELEKISDLSYVTLYDLD
jgi:hypothetical protein